VPTTGKSETIEPLVMIAGGGGFLGSAVARAMVSRGWRVVTLGLGGPTGPVDRMVEHHEGLLTRDLFAAATGMHGRPDILVHAAGGASVGRSWEDPRGDFDLSVASTVEILDFIRNDSKQTHLVFVSSAAVYGNCGDAPLVETDPCEPVSPYGVHKHVCEQLAIGESRMNALGLSIIRFFSIYGDGLRKQILWDILRRAGGNPDAPLELWGTGDETRDFLHVDDAAELIARAAETRTRDSIRLFNGGSGISVTVREIATELIAAAGSDTAFRFNGNVREGDPKHLIANVDRATTELGFNAGISLKEGLARYANWFKQTTETGRGEKL
jgi:UDP-glucose 4-epimerase